MWIYSTKKYYYWKSCMKISSCNLKNFMIKVMIMEKNWSIPPRYILTQSDHPVLTWLIKIFLPILVIYNSPPTPYCPIPPLIVELQTTLRQRNLIQLRAFDTVQRPPNAEEDSLNVDTSDPPIFNGRYRCWKKSWRRYRIITGTKCKQLICF